MAQQAIELLTAMRNMTPRSPKNPEDAHVSVSSLQSKQVLVTGHFRGGR